MSRKKLATVWLAGCSGCHMSFLDIDERILDLAAVADIVKCPLVDAKSLPEVDVTLVEGAVATDEHLEELLHIRKQSRIVVSFGDCAVTGNVPMMRNAMEAQDVIDYAYRLAPSNVPGPLPNHPMLGKLLGKVAPLHQYVKVDCHIPGCPPSPNLIFYAVSELLAGRQPVLDRGRLKYG